MLPVSQLLPSLAVFSLDQKQRYKKYEIPSGLVLTSIIPGLAPIDVYNCQLVCKNWYQIFSSKEAQRGDPNGARFLHRFIKQQQLQCLKTITPDPTTLPKDEESMMHALEVGSNRIVTGLSQGKMNIYDLQTGEPLFHLSTHWNTVDDLQIVGNTLFSSDGTTFNTWELATGELVAELKSDNKGMVCFRSVGDLQIYCFSDATMEIHNSKTSAVRKARLEQSMVRYLRVKKDRIFLGFESGKVQVFDFNCQLKDIFDISKQTTCLQVDKKVLFCNDTDSNKIERWDLNTHALIDVLDYHEDMVTCFQILGTLLISGSIDGKMTIFDLETKQCLSTFECDSPIIAMRVEEGKVVTGHMDHSIRIWGI